MNTFAMWVGYAVIVLAALYGGLLTVAIVVGAFAQLFTEMGAWAERKWRAER